jgi:Amt family ammonium transporter
VGYSLAFTEGSSIIGGLGRVFLRGLTLDGAHELAKTIPETVFLCFQLTFAIITPALIAGAFAERVRFRGYCVFIALWSLLVYAPLCHIIWGSGFLSGKAIDFAGGTVIHISAGVAGLVAAFYLGARHGYPKTAMHPNNLVMTMVGAGLLWVGWFGFNAGSSVASGLKTAQALTMTQVAAAMGALTWMVLEGIRHRKVTSLGVVSGILAGLVAVTPAAGDVLPWGALVLGALASLCAYGAIMIKNKLGYDDTLDVFGIHGVAGIVGAIALTFMLRPGRVASVSEQLGHQVVCVILACVVSAVVTLILLVLVDKTVGLKLGVGKEQEGMDHSLHGEHGYGLLNLN